MPSQDRIGGYNRRNLAQQATPQRLPAPCESAPLLVGQPRSLARELTSQGAVLFDQIGDDVLVGGDVTNGECCEKNPCSDLVNHGRQAILTTRFRSVMVWSADLRDTTGVSKRRVVPVLPTVISLWYSRVI
jgi:hypothetical protein